MRIRKLFILNFVVMCSLTMYQSARASTTGDVQKLLVGEIKDLVLMDPPKEVPGIGFVTEGGEKRLLKDFQGQVVVVNFWATWCPPCIQEMGSLDKLASDFKETDVKVLTISLDSGENRIEKVRNFYDKQQIKNLGIYFDTEQELYRSFKPRGLPSTFILSRAGKVIGQLDGPVVWDSPEVKALINHYVDEK